MGSFRYQAVEASGGSVSGIIEASDRKSALSLLSGKGLFPSELEACASNDPVKPVVREERSSVRFRIGSGISRKQVTAFTRELAALLGAGDGDDVLALRQHPGERQL